MSPETVYIKWLPSIQEELCTGCRMCVQSCRCGSLAMKDGVAELAHPERCKSGGHCRDACPMGGIHMEWSVLNGDHAVGSWRISNQDYPGFTD